MRHVLRRLALCSVVPFVLEAQSSCPSTVASGTAWTPPLDRVVSLSAGRFGIRDALDRAAAATGVQFTFQTDVLPRDAKVCVAPGRGVPLGDLLQGWLGAYRLRAVGVGEGRVVLAPVVSADVAPPGLTDLRQTPVELTPIDIRGATETIGVSTVGVSRTILGRQELEATGATNVGEALSGAVPGLWMWAGGASAGTRVASMRGASSFGATYPKVFVDGIEVASPMFLAQLATEQIQRVEVIRGPQGAALYGAGAVAGVINITTRVAGPTEQNGVSVRGVAGLAESAWSPVGAFVQDHAFSVRGGEPQRAYGLGLSTSTMGAFIPDAFTRQLQGTSGFSWLGERNRLQASARLFVQRTGNARSPLLPPALAAALLPSGALYRPWSGNGAVSGSPPDSVTVPGVDGTQDVHEYTVGGTWTRQGTRWLSTFTSGVDGYRLQDVDVLVGQLRTPGDSALLAASGGADRLSARWNAVANFNAESPQSLRLAVGADHSALRDASLGTSLGQRIDEAVSPIWRTTMGLHASADATLGGALLVNAGVRAERNTGYTIMSGVSMLPSLGALYRAPWRNGALTLRSAYGKAIAPPRLSTREAPWGGRVPAVLSLQPESQTGVEFGADLRLGAHFVTHVTAYDQRASNLIQPVATMSGQDQRLRYQLQNVGEITNRGWEFETEVTSGRLSLNGALGLVNSRVARVAAQYGGEMREGDRVLQVPSRTISLSANWRETQWSFSGAISRAADWVNYDWQLLGGDLSNPGMAPPRGAGLRSYWKSYDGVTRVRASLTRDLSKAFGIVVTGDNLFNQQRGEPDNITVVPGRTVRAGLRAKW